MLHCVACLTTRAIFRHF